MTVNGEQALRLETEFLSGVEHNFEEAKGRDFRGSIWKKAGDDDGDRLRSLLAAHRQYDRNRLKSLPSNRRVVLQGFDRLLGLWKRRTGVAIASVLCPLEELVASSDGAAGPVGLGDLVDHVRRLVQDAKVPHIVGVCSPTGFTQEARRARLDVPRATVILIEPDGHGGWRVEGSEDKADPRLLRIFDPEGTKQKLDRVTRMIEADSTALLTAGVSASSVAEKAGLPEEVVRRAFDQVAARDPELRVSRKGGEMLMFRGAPLGRPEKKSMNVVERIKRLFAREGEEPEKINLLAERRAELARRRDRIYDDIGKLESREAQLFEEGKAATSQVPRRRIAAQLAQLRKDIARQNATAAMLNQQINILSTDIHNLTLIQQGEMAQLPNTAELTENAVKAEEMLETLAADAEMVNSLEAGMESSLTSDDELAILREFEAASSAGPTATPAAPAKSGDQAAREKPQAPRRAPAEAEPPDRAFDPPSDKGTREKRSRDAEPN